MGRNPDYFVNKYHGGKDYLEYLVHHPTIVEYQEAEPQFVQYIFNPVLATEKCSYWELDDKDLWNSMKENEATPFLKNGKYLLEQ